MHLPCDHEFHSAIPFWYLVYGAFVGLILNIRYEVGTGGQIISCRKLRDHAGPPLGQLRVILKLDDLSDLGDREIGTMFKLRRMKLENLSSP